MSDADLVRRLREHVQARGGATIENGAWQAMTEAAARIEALVAEVRRLEAFRRQAASRLNTLTTYTEDAPQWKRAFNWWERERTGEESQCAP